MILAEHLQIKEVTDVTDYTLYEMGSPKAPVKISPSLVKRFPLLAQSKHYSPNVKLIRPMGFEFTFEKSFDVKEKKKCDNYKCYIQEAQKLKKLKIHTQPGIDGGCLELSTPAFHHSHDVLNFFNIIKSTLPKEIVHKNPWSTGGGCHIHINLTQKLGQKIGHPDLDFLIKLGAVHHNRPFLTPALQDPYDDESSEFIPFHQFFLINSTIILNVDGLGSKSVSIRYDETYKTLELRYFDTVADWKELEDHIKVANHILKLASEPKESLSDETVDDEFHRREWNKFKKNANLKYLGDSKLEERLLFNQMKMMESIDLTLKQQEADRIKNEAFDRYLFSLRNPIVTPSSENIPTFKQVHKIP